MGEDKVVVTKSDRLGWWETEDQHKKQQQYDRDYLKKFVDSVKVKDGAGNSHGLSDQQKEECVRMIEAREKGYELGVFWGRRGSRLVMRKVYDSIADVIATGVPVVGSGRTMTRKFEQKWLKSKKQ